jgi:hypothetical protein
MFAERLGPVGVSVRCPDFNEPEFETLTVSRMVGQLEADMAAQPPGPIALIGSSLGGFVALHAALRQTARIAAGERPAHRIDRLVLLVPALEFGRSSYGTVTPAQVEQWRKTGWLDVFHYGDNRPARVGSALVDDALGYDSFGTMLKVPTLIFQGSRDALVEPAMVRRYAAKQPYVALRMLDDDHLLMGTIETILDETEAFFGAVV